MSRLREFLSVIVLCVFLMVLTVILIGLGGAMAGFEPGEQRAPSSSILALDLDGVIIDAKDILDLLRKHRDDDHIKGVLIRINSPGGVVGPSQELFNEIKRTREEYKKPVVAFCSAVAASGAYYAAAAADKIVTTPGCMMGSIGVIMQLANLEKLYDWAKIERYSITTGKFKDAGADYKPLRPEERALFQEMLDDVLAQFKGAIVEGRKMKPEFLDQYADGRIFTGQQAVKLGFADQVGSWDDARQMIGEMVGLGKDPEVFKARKRRDFFEFMDEASTGSKVKQVLDQALRLELRGQPLFILPGAL